MAKLYNRGNGIYAEAWTEEDDRKLVDLTIKNKGELALIVRDFEYNRSHKAVRNRQSLLRKKGILIQRLREPGGSKSSLMTLPQAEELMARLNGYWLSRGYTEHKFWAERVGEIRYVVRSNLVGGRPPGPRNKMVR